MNDDALFQAVQDSVEAGVAARSVPFNWNGEKYWVKIGLPAQGNVWHKVQNTAAFLLRNPMLKVTVSAPLDEGLKAEARRLAKVRERGVIAPKVVSCQPGWLLIEDIGTSLYSEIENSTDRESLIFKGVQSLARLHQMGGWHGTGQLRDMVLTPSGEIGFIDFEENVGEVMEPAAAQARDLLRFLISSVRFDAGDGRLLRSIMQYYRQEAPEAVWPHIQKILNLIAPLACLLKPFEKSLGRDVRHAFLVIKTLKGVF